MENIFKYHLLVMLLINCAPTFALSNHASETFEHEPPVIRNWLVKAGQLLTHDETDASWKAADLYCRATRSGSAEGAYRLGMLYAVGEGVPASREYAANLFRIASQHGHVEAQNMLETVKIVSNKNPACVLASVKPKKGLPKPPKPEIDAYVATLPKDKRWVVNLVEKVSDWHAVDSKLVLSIITAESNFKVGAESDKNAQGLMQLIPATAERFNVKNAYNATQNIRGGVKYLRWLLSYFRGDVTLTVAAYNSGERTVDRYKGIPPYKETKAYVKKVMALYAVKKHEYDESLTSASPIVKYNKKKAINVNVMGG